MLLLPAALAMLSFLQAGLQAGEAERSVHRAQGIELGAALDAVTDDGREARRLEEEGRLFPPLPATAASTSSRLDEDFVVFGYLQSETQVFHTRWHALTHVGSRFVGFDAGGHLTGTGAFTGRSSYLKAGGAAEAAGVKVTLVVNSFDDGPGGVIETVVTDPGLRATLAGEIAALLAADGYAQGVSLDLEFSWGPLVRDGVTALMADLRAALDAVDPALELSLYVNAIFSPGQWDFDPAAGITPHVDFVLYSMYDWATGQTAHAISDLDNDLGPTRLHGYLDDGLPPEKLVPVISAYSRQWANTGVYNGTGTSSSSSGFTDGLYDVTLNPLAGGPYAPNHVRGDEAGWYTWNDGIQRTRTWESPEALEVEIRHVLSLRDPSGTWSGRRLGGVGFWSLMWMAETSSFDPRAGVAVARTRTYPHVYELCQEVLGAPGECRHAIERFDGLDFRWRDPNESPDTAGDLDGDSGIALAPTPAGPGAPAGSAFALQVAVDLEGTEANRLVVAHEVLAGNLAPAVTDTNAVAGTFDATSALSVHVHVPAALPGYGLRLVLVDAAGQLEGSPLFPLDAAGWRRLAWDLTASAEGLPTSEPAFASGDGVLDTAGGGARDLGLLGVRLEGFGPLTGLLTLDDFEREPSLPGGRAYVINELRYADPSAELVEVYGPAGPLPPGLELRFLDGATGDVAAAHALTGSIADDGGGYGFLVVGDPGVPNVDLTAGFAVGVDDVPDADPSAVQLVDALSGAVHDSLVYEAFGGLDELVRPGARGVTGEGRPWLGEIGPGTDGSGHAYVLGRWPDGADSNRNAVDFGFQLATPGEPNGAALALGSSLDFETVPAELFQTFGTPVVGDPVLVGLPASAGGGLAYRCVDPSGGGVIGVLGDAALGASSGWQVTGELWLPGPGEPPQAVAVGFCASQGSRFFTSTDAHRSAYEDGFWLVFENAPGVGLNDGRPDHPGVVELVQASNDNQDGEAVTLLASFDLAAKGLAPGAWAPFLLALERRGPDPPLLVVLLGGQLVHRGELPVGAPLSGAVTVGFRENHPGPPAAREGAWVDTLSIVPRGGRAPQRATPRPR